MGWKLIILVSANLVVHLSSGQESQISENEVINTSRKVPEKGIFDLIEILNDLSTTTLRLQNDSHPPADCPSCECGKLKRKHPNGKPMPIAVGGYETDVLEFPWMALLLDDGEFFCGGTLLNDYYVLTAAHCTFGSKDLITVRLMEHDRSQPNETTTIDRKVSAIIRHHEYNSFTSENDIALLKLDERVDLGRASSEIRDIVRLRPVCLPSPEYSYVDYIGVVAGWGDTEESGNVSNTLQMVIVPIISNEDCRKTGYGEHRITDNMLCAGYPEGGKDSCQGDSGGPLQILNYSTRRYEEVGVVSWGYGCARPDYPGVYSRVNRYLSWIQSNTKDACYCQ